MFRMSMAGRTTRALAAAALIFSLSATTFAGSAFAAPLAENGCSAAAHARNDAVHLLHTAWKVFNGDLQDLARDARKLQHESHKKGDVVLNDARQVVADAKHEIKGIRSQAQEDIQAAVELGTACSDEDDTKSSTNTTTTTTTTNNSATAPSDASPPADTSGGAHTFDTSGLDAKYKGIVEKAIQDMQKVVDDTRKALTDMTTVAEEAKDLTDDSKVKKDLEAAKADREKAKSEREHGKSDKTKAKSTTKTHDGDKGKVHDRNTSHRDENDND
jgi:hypothetical protein